MTEITINTRTKSLPTTNFSKSIKRGSIVDQDFRRILCQMSIVKIVEDELKIEVKEDINAANITANINPRRPKIMLI